MQIVCHNQRWEQINGFIKYIIEIDLNNGVKVNYAKLQGVEVAQEGKKALKVDLLAKIQIKDGEIFVFRKDSYREL